MPHPRQAILVLASGPFSRFLLAMARFALRIAPSRAADGASETPIAPVFPRWNTTEELHAARSQFK